MVSVFELFKIGIGPSSSHTVGPMKAAAAFTDGLARAGLLPATARIRVELFGSLAWTGKGHGTQPAVILGLAGQHPDTVDGDAAAAIIGQTTRAFSLDLHGEHRVAFAADRDVVFNTLSPTPVHPNTLAFSAFDATGSVLATERWCSVGGGFVVPEAQVGALPPETVTLPFPFRSGAELLMVCRRNGIGIARARAGQ